jgi:glutamyl-tRNA synthetase
MSVRVRFAPSPTGLLHVGALRTALFVQLFARNQGGKLFLRIEDTDRSRYNPASEQEFIETLNWVGITFDEGPHVGGPHSPYRQSERKEAGIYAPLAQQLVDAGHAYPAFDTSEELTEMREIQQINKQPTGYFGGKWRDATPDMVEAAKAEGKPFVLRQRVPRGIKITVEDAIRGRIEFDSDTLDDSVLIKTDGMPTYHFASMVDDHLMETTHIMRGEEWVSSSPKHALLFDQFGWPRPVFIHLPVIVGSDGKKLSKRHGATRVLDYMAQGYHPHALKNFVALIGWAPGDDRESMTEDELIAAFDLRGLQPSPGKFDLEKLRWLNGHQIRQMTIDELLDNLLRYVNDPYVKSYWNAPDSDGDIPNPEVWPRLERLAQAVSADREYFKAALALEQERVQTLADFGEALEFFLVNQPSMDEKAVKKWLTQPHVPALFEHIIAHPGETTEHYDALLRAYGEANGFEKLGPIVHPTRVALTGKTFGPGLFELMALLGPARVEARLRRALAAD